MVQIDSRGIQWLLATGEQTVQPQTRTDANDFRWSRNYENALCGFEVTGIGTFTGVASGGHYALKHWGPNHSAPCGYEESGECCCWYDTGIRADGTVQLQTERPHPSNHDFTLSFNASTGPLYKQNIGQAMDGNDIGLKWIFYPILQNGNADNGGMRLKMYSCINALSGGLPTNAWQLCYDFIDNTTMDILTNYDVPEEQEIEVRNSDTNDTEFYGGGIHVRRLLPTDIYGGGQGCAAGTHYDTATGQCIPDSTTCPAGQHWDWTLGQCVLDAVPPPPPPSTTTKQTDLKLFLSGGLENQNPQASLGGHMSSKEFLGSYPHEILDRVSLTEMQSGMTDHHLLYLKNTNTLYAFNNIRIFVLQNTINPFDTILLGLAAAGKNMDEYPLNIDTVVPPNVSFTAADTSTTGLVVPSLGPNEKIGMWIKRVLNQGSEPHAANLAKIAFDFSPAAAPSDPNVPPIIPPVTCVTGTHWDATLNRCVDDSIPPPPPDPTDINFSVAVVSDMQCGSTFENIYSDLKTHNPVRILCSGDFLKDGNCIIDTVNDTRDKWIITMGNHDTNESQPQPETENDVRTFGRFPTQNYYTTTFNNVAVLVFDATGDTTSGAQATFMDQELQRLSNNSAIEWIFVVQHYPFYSTEGNHNNDVDQREYWHPKFDQYKVDAMFNGHNHTGEVTSLIRYNAADSDAPIITQSGGTYSYFRGTANHGMMFIQCPTAGDSNYGMGSEQDYHEFTVNNDGYILMEFSEEGRKCTFKVMNASGSAVYTCSITHRV